jgi:hypothetical protein
MSPCLCLYSHTTYRNATKHKIQLRMCNLFLCIILPRSRLLVRNNDAGAERVFGTRSFKIFSVFLKSFSRDSLNFFITCEVDSFIERCEQPAFRRSLGLVWSNCRSDNLYCSWSGSTIVASGVAKHAMFSLQLGKSMFKFSAMAVWEILRFSGIRSSTFVCSNRELPLQSFQK